MMAASTSISIASHNIHGFADRKDFLHSCCHSNPLLIQCLQEHWLRPTFKKKVGCNALRSVHVDFEGFATSAMKQTEENQIRRGRGFGGTGFIYPKCLSNNIKPLLKYNHDRITVMELKCTNYDLIIINVYMPFLDRSDLQNAVSKFDEMIGFVEFIMNDRSDAQFVLPGDFNCNIYKPTHPYAASLNDFVHSHNLVCTFSKMETFNVDDTYTRTDSRSKSLLDYVFVSHEISKNITKVIVCEYHDNHSDHLPVEVELSLQMSNITDKATKSLNGNANILWSKLSPNNLNNYSSTMETALDLIDIPPSILHGQYLCQDDTHKYDIELYFTQIVDSIMLADSMLKRTSFRALKPYWSPELSSLKRQSFITHKTWLENNKPSVGPIYDNYITARVNYRKTL